MLVVERAVWQTKPKFKTLTFTGIVLRNTLVLFLSEKGGLDEKINTIFMKAE